MGATHTNFDAAKDRTRDVRAGRHQMDGEQYRRELRAALYDLQQKLGQCHKARCVLPVAVTADPAPSIEYRIRRKLVQRLRGFYTVFTLCGLA
ncbi:MAG: hypothetical protein ABIR36_03950 [Nitrospiraceae bacterium]